MMNFKSRNGFTLLETLIAMLIATMVLMPIFGVLSGVFKQVVFSDHHIERLMNAQTFLQETTRTLDRDAKEFHLEKKIDDPETYLRYELKPCAERLKLEGHDIYSIQLTMTWQEGNQSRQEVIKTFMYRVVKEEKKS
jgi:prepilin-type N-terminal cleavage/methylation domain-containing protein